MFVWFLMLNHCVKTKLNKCIKYEVEDVVWMLKRVEIVFFTLINRETDGFMNKNE